MEINKRNRNILFIIFIGLVFISLIIFNMYNGKEENPSVYSAKNYNILKDYNRFFTINSCINRYVIYLQSKDSDSLLQVLDKEYINNNQIDTNNIYDFLGIIEGNNSFIPKKIYYENINSNFIKYYVHGYISKETMDNMNVEKTEKYFIVTFDLKNQTFSIKPYSGTIFMEDNNG